MYPYSVAYRESERKIQVLWQRISFNRNCCAATSRKWKHGHTVVVLFFLNWDWNQEKIILPGACQTVIRELRFDTRCTLSPINSKLEEVGLFKRDRILARWSFISCGKHCCLSSWFEMARVIPVGSFGWIVQCPAFLESYHSVCLRDTLLRLSSLLDDSARLAKLLMTANK